MDVLTADLMDHHWVDLSVFWRAEQLENEMVEDLVALMVISVAVSMVEMTVDLMVHDLVVKREIEMV